MAHRSNTWKVICPKCDAVHNLRADRELPNCGDCLMGSVSVVKMKRCQYWSTQTEYLTTDGRPGAVFRTVMAASKEQAIRVAKSRLLTDEPDRTITGGDAELSGWN